MLTFMGAEAILAILLKVVCGGAPEEAIAAASVCAATVFPTIKQERELAVLAISIPILYSDHCRTHRALRPTSPGPSSDTGLWAHPGG